MPFGRSRQATEGEPPVGLGALPTLLLLPPLLLAPPLLPPLGGACAGFAVAEMPRSEAPHPSQEELLDGDAGSGVGVADDLDESCPATLSEKRCRAAAGDWPDEPSCMRNGLAAGVELDEGPEGDVAGGGVLASRGDTIAASIEST